MVAGSMGIELRRLAVIVDLVAIVDLGFIGLLQHSIWLKHQLIGLAQL